MIRPVDAEISQRFGDNPTRDLPPDSWLIRTFGNYQPDGHTGEDYKVDVGTPIRAVTSGTVLHVGYYTGSYADNPEWIAPNFAGWCYVVNHDPAPGFPGGFIGIYAHGQENENRVSADQRVAEGQVIGLSGNTGGSTGPHLHFEILPDGWVTNSYMYGRVDPEQLFSSGLAAMGTITPLQEADVLTDEDKVWIGEKLYAVLEDPNVLEKLRAGIINDTSLVNIQGTVLPTLQGHAQNLWNGLQAVPAAVLNQSFKLPDGTVTNLAGILTAINAKPVSGASAGPVSTDAQAVANAVVATLSKQLGK